MVRTLDSSYNFFDLFTLVTVDSRPQLDKKPSTADMYNARRQIWRGADQDFLAVGEEAAWGWGEGIARSGKGDGGLGKSLSLKIL